MPITLAAKYNKTHMYDNIIGSTSEAGNVFANYLRKNKVEISRHRILNISPTAMNYIVTCVFDDNKSNPEFKEIWNLKTSETLPITYFHVYIKFDRRPWYNAGRATGKFDGVGCSFNAIQFSKFNILRVESTKQSYILYVLPKYFYFVDFDEINDVRVEEIQDFNDENVTVIPLNSFKSLKI